MKKILSLLLICIFVFWGLQSFAMTLTTAKRKIWPNPVLFVNPDDEIRVDPDYPADTNTFYDFDWINFDDYKKSNKPSIMKIKCNGKDILNSLGITNSKIVSVWVLQWDFTYSYDFNNCSFRAIRTKYIQATEPLIDSDALKMANDFVIKNESLGIYKKLLGDPVITYRSNYDYAGVFREWKSYSTTVVFPIKINWKTVYQNYWEPLWLTLEVNNKWINSINVQVLPFALIKADSTKLDFNSLLSFLKKWANSPYYNYNMSEDDFTTVKGLSYENIYVFSQKYPLYGGAPSLYITSWIRIKTDKQIDNGPEQDKKDYIMIISDYQIGNSQNYPSSY